ncbi:MAG: hypothetical protein IIY93_05330 [Clostridia bacterium]|nr:hypothetical protein [Clostridia bacterium]
MIASDEDALACDLLETYGVNDYRELPPKTVAALYFGLTPNSRTKSRQMGLSVPLDTFLLAQAVDALHLLCWLNSKDGEKGRNRPERISDKLILKEPVADNGRFESGEDFESFRARFFTSPKEGE